MTHRVAAAVPRAFLGWPANNGAWSWDDGRTLLVGFTQGPYQEQPGHNIAGLTDEYEGYRSGLARSLDGGDTWSVEYPQPFIETDAPVQELPTPLDLAADGLALRMIGAGYHGSRRPEGAFLVSTDRGRTWAGPFRLTGLMDTPPLHGMQFTGRTAYLIIEDRILLFGSVRRATGGVGRDRAFVATSVDCGMTFHFAGWMTSTDDPYRSVMPAPVLLPNGRLVAALRRRHPDDPQAACWIDVTYSDDGGVSWSTPQRVAETGGQNGNPPALVVWPDGSLTCVYGDRASGTMQMRSSVDGVSGWGAPHILRDAFLADTYGDMDFGYPRVWINARGQLVVAYYWADESHPEQYIAVTLVD